MKTREEICVFVRRKTEQTFNFWAVNSGLYNARKYLAWEHIRAMLDVDGMSMIAVKHKISCKIKANLAWINAALKNYKTYKEQEEEIACVNAETAEFRGFMELLDED